MDFSLTRPYPLLANHFLKKYSDDQKIKFSKEALKMTPANYDVFYSISYTNFLYYLHTRDAQPMGVSDEVLASEKISIRNKKETYILKAQDYLERALKIRHQDYKIQILAILIYFERLKDIPNHESRSQITETSDLKSKIERHGKEYLIYKRFKLK